MEKIFGEFMHLYFWVFIVVFLITVANKVISKKDEKGINVTEFKLSFDSEKRDDVIDLLRGTTAICLFILSCKY